MNFVSRCKRLQMLPMEMVEEIADVAPWCAVNALVRTCKRMAVRDIFTRHARYRVETHAHCSTSSRRYPNGIRHGDSNVFATVGRSGMCVFTIAYDRDQPLIWMSRLLDGTVFMGDASTRIFARINHRHLSHESDDDTLYVWRHGRGGKLKYLFAGTRGTWDRQHKGPMTIENVLRWPLKLALIGLPEIMVPIRVERVISAMCVGVSVEGVHERAY